MLSRNLKNQTNGKCFNSNLFNPSKKNYFGCAANRNIGNRKSQRLISTPTYSNMAYDYVSMFQKSARNKSVCNNERRVSCAD
jgi:uncharacterized Zn-finger protein